MTIKQHVLVCLGALGVLPSMVQAAVSEVGLGANARS